MGLTRDIIGNKTYIDLPTAGVSKVLAKVDSGADSSSIWASDISEQNGVLSFKLFGKSSAHYTGKVIETKDYSQLSIKNSFGHVQMRYRVVLKTRINGRLVKVHYTLANRSKNSAPVLIGRKTLSGKFLIDVAQKAEKRQQKVLIVTKLYSKELALFAANVKKSLGRPTIDYVTYDEIAITFIDGQMSAYIDKTGTDLASYDVVHFKTSTKRDLTSSLAHYARSKGVTVLDAEAISGFPTMSKLYEYTLLTLSGILIPDSVFITPQRAETSYRLFVSKLGTPFVLKDIHGRKGDHNEVIHNQHEFRAMLQRVKPLDIHLIGQKFIPNNGDYRILVMGTHIELVMYRSRVDNRTHLNNTTQGGRAAVVKITDLPAEVRRNAIRAARLMGRTIAGVDMVQDSGDRKWYCFEVNDGPQIVTGAFLEQKRTAYAAYIKRILEKRL